MDFAGGSDSKHLSTMWEKGVQSLGWEDPLEKEMGIHSPKATFNFIKNYTHTIQTCIITPSVFMIRAAKYDPNLGLVTCINCSFCTWVNNTIPFDESWQSIYILKTKE